MLPSYEEEKTVVNESTGNARNMSGTGKCDRSRNEKAMHGENENNVLYNAM